jgi:molecular chaperone DnaK
MVADAEKFAAEDHTRRETAEARNQADQVAYQVDKFVEENGDKIPEADKTELMKVNGELKEVLKDEGADAERMRGASDATMQVFQRIGQSMYEAQQAQAASEPQAAAGGGGPTGPASEAPSESEDDVVEGEIVDEGGAS